MTPEEKYSNANHCLIYDKLICCCKKNRDCEICEYRSKIINPEKNEYYKHSRKPK